MSFAFTIAKGGESWEKPGADGQRMVTVTDVDQLYDVSIVTQPAYEQTSATMRDRQDAQKRAVRARRDDLLAQAEDALSRAQDARVTL